MPVAPVAPPIGSNLLYQNNELPREHHREYQNRGESDGARQDPRRDEICNCRGNAGDKHVYVGPASLVCAGRLSGCRLLIRGHRSLGLLLCHPHQFRSGVFPGRWGKLALPVDRNVLGARQSDDDVLAQGTSGSDGCPDVSA